MWFREGTHQDENVLMCPGISTPPQQTSSHHCNHYGDDHSPACVCKFMCTHVCKKDRATNIQIKYTVFPKWTDSIHPSCITERVALVRIKGDNICIAEISLFFKNLLENCSRFYLYLLQWTVSTETYAKKSQNAETLSIPTNPWENDTA